MGYLLPLLLVALALCVSPTHAFGAGNIASISSIEGSNWRHGDLEDTLLQLFLAAAATHGKRRKFSSMDVKRIYFGNWLRDYSQAIDTGSLKYVEAPTIRILLWILGFMTFGYATEEFEVTAERLGCYRPEEHIDNPKDYNDNNDAREYDRRLRGPVDEETELGVDPETGLKNYIANERIRSLRNGDAMNTSAGLLRRLFGRSIELGRQYKRSGKKEDLFEAFRLMGTGLHCIEDYSAHSNYTELALIELGETDVFPHVGSRTMVNIHGREIWPIVTGTFGGVDFLHSVLGEFSDKAIQSELAQLETTISDASNKADKDGGEDSIIKELMSKLNIGGKDDLGSKADELKAKSKAQKQATQQSNSPWGLGSGADDLAREIYPFLEFHDNLMKKINEALETMGIDAIIEKLSEAVSLFVFSLIAPFVLPVLKQVSTELKTGSSEVIASSAAAQHIVFEDNYSSNPTHSMLSKDHFTNLLNEPAGKIASAVLKFAVPLLMEAWDNDSIDPNHVCDQIIGGVFHHPAFRNGEDRRPGVEGRRVMFAVVEEWWNSKDRREQDEFRRNLSREGVLDGRNHKTGVHDSGHGCGKPLHRVKPNHKGGEIGGIGGEIGQVVGGALENALSGGGKTDTGGLGNMLGGMLGGALAENLFSGIAKEEKKVETTYRQETSYGSREETSSYSSYSRGGGESADYYQPPRTTYETRESYTESTPEYTRTTERYGGSGRDTVERTYESGRGGYGGDSYGSSGRGDYGSSGRGEYGSGRGEYGSYGRGDYESGDNYGSGRGGYGASDTYSSGRGGYGGGEETYGGGGGYGERLYETRGGYPGRGEHHSTTAIGYGKSDDREKEEKKKQKEKDKFGEKSKEKKSEKKSSEKSSEKRSKSSERSSEKRSKSSERKKKSGEKEKDRGGKYHDDDEEEKEHHGGYGYGGYKKDDTEGYKKKKDKKHDDDDYDYSRDSGDEKKKYTSTKKHDSGDEKRFSKKKDYDSGDEKKYKKKDYGDSGEEKKKKHGKKEKGSDDERYGHHGYGHRGGRYDD